MHDQSSNIQIYLMGEFRDFSMDDLELVKQSMKGDAAAFEHLVEKHYLMVYKLSYRWCGIKEDAEDITQNVFVKLAGKIKKFRLDSAFKTWLYRITINTAKDYYRKKKLNKDKEAAYVENQVFTESNKNQDCSFVSSHISSALDKLPVKQKEAVLLIFCEGLSHKEAAAILCCAETTISWRIFQAKKKLEKLLAHFNPHNPG